LSKHLTDDNHRALLARAKHKSSREIDVLVAEVAPRPDVPSQIRALPIAKTPVVPVADATECAREVLGPGERCVSNRVPTGPDGPGQSGAVSEWAPDAFELTAAPSHSAARAAKPVPDRKQVVALAPRRFKIEITVDQCTHDKLRSLQDLLRHQFPSADPAMIVSRAIELLLDETLRKKAAVTGRARSGIRTGVRPSALLNAQPNGESAAGDAPARVTARAPRTRTIPAAIRREVWKRDVGRCTFVDEYGRRCKATSCIEYHHVIPYGKGGRHSVGNIALRCRPHNQYQAELDYGRGFVRRSVVRGNRLAEPNPPP